MGQKKKKAARSGKELAPVSPRSDEQELSSPQEEQAGAKDNGRHVAETETSSISKFLQADSAAVQERVERIQDLLGSEAQLTLAQRADLVYNRRPEILDLVNDLQQAYLILARRYDHVAGKVVRLTKSADSPVLDAPILRPLSASKRRTPKKAGNGNLDKRGETNSATVAIEEPPVSSLNPDATPFEAVSPPPQLNPEAAPFTPSQPASLTGPEAALYTPSQPIAPVSEQVTLFSNGGEVVTDPETPRMSAFHFQEIAGSGSGNYNVEEEGPLHAGHLYSDLSRGREGPVHGGHAVGSWGGDRPFGDWTSEQGPDGLPDFQEVVTLDVASAGAEAELELGGAHFANGSESMSAFLATSRIQEEAGRKRGLSEAVPQLRLGAGLEEGPVHAGHALMVRGASTNFERELKLTAQIAEALARDRMRAKKYSDLEVEVVLQVKPVVKQSLLKETGRGQREGGSDVGNERLERIGDSVQETRESVQETGQVSDVLDAEPEHPGPSVLDTQRLQGELDDLVTQKRDAIRYLTECVDTIREEKKDVAKAAGRLAAENLALRERLEEVLSGAERGVWGFGDDRQGWGDVISEALTYGRSCDVSTSSNAARASISGAGVEKGRKFGGVVIREPKGAGIESGEWSGMNRVSEGKGTDRKGKGKVVESAERAATDAERNGESGRSTLQDLREENEYLRRALAAVGGARGSK